MNGFNRYLKIMEWVLRRYTVNGKLVVWEGKNATIYTHIERLAAKKYLGI